MILLPKPPKIVNKKENWARFEIEGLYPGYGITIGNSLRRVLLSSLEGAAVTQVNIRGIQHEFSTIDGVLEDVIHIMMNLKKMRFKVYTDEPQKAFLKAKGEKEVKGSDFEFPTQVELVNQSCHIATLTNKKAEVEMEIQIEKGIGYQAVEQTKKRKKTDIGALPLDAIFTPVKRVNYKVENMRVGERTDFDKLYLEITTDGTIIPEEAFKLAADILIKHFSLFSENFETLGGSKTVENYMSQGQEKIAKTEKKTQKAKKEKKLKKEAKKGKESKKKAKKESKKKS